MSLPIVMTIFLLINVAYFAGLSYSQIRGSEAVGLVSAAKQYDTYLHPFLGLGWLGLGGGDWTLLQCIM